MRTALVIFLLLMAIPAWAQDYYADYRAQGPVVYPPGQTAVVSPGPAVAAPGTTVVGSDHFASGTYPHGYHVPYAHPGYPVPPSGYYAPPYWTPGTAAYSHEENAAYISPPGGTYVLPSEPGESAVFVPAPPTYVYHGGYQGLPGQQAYAEYESYNGGLYIAPGSGYQIQGQSYYPQTLPPGQPTTGQVPTQVPGAHSPYYNPYPPPYAAPPTVIAPSQTQPPRTQHTQPQGDSESPGDPGD